MGGSGYEWRVAPPREQGRGPRYCRWLVVTKADEKRIAELVKQAVS